MHQDKVSEMATQFTAAYQALKEKKELEKLFTIIKPMILSAKADGVSDKELIELINALGLRGKFYPAKLQGLRGRLGKSEPELATNDGEVPATCKGALHPILAALSARPEGVAA